MISPRGPEGISPGDQEQSVIFYQGKGQSHSGVSSVSSAHMEGSCISELLPMHETQVSLSNSPQGTGGMRLSSATRLSPLFRLAPAMWKEIKLFLQIKADSKRCYFSKILKDLFPGSGEGASKPSFGFTPTSPVCSIIHSTFNSPLVSCLPDPWDKL